MQPFFLSHIDPVRHNAFDEIVAQARDENAFRGLPSHIYLTDPYNVHRSPLITETTVRSFVRMTMTMNELEDPANTINRGIPVEQAYGKRIEIRDRLSKFEGPIPWKLYGIEPKSIALKPAGRVFG